VLKYRSTVSVHHTGNRQYNDYTTAWTTRGPGLHSRCGAKDFNA